MEIKGARLELLFIAMVESSRQASYRSLFRHELDAEAVSDIRLALSQSQPLGNARFMETIEQMTGQRREVKPRGRPKGKGREGEVLNTQEQIEW